MATTTKNTGEFIRFASFRSSNGKMKLHCNRTAISLHCNTKKKKNKIPTTTKKKHFSLKFCKMATSNGFKCAWNNFFFWVFCAHRRWQMESKQLYYYYYFSSKANKYNNYNSTVKNMLNKAKVPIKILENCIYTTKNILKSPWDICERDHETVSIKVECLHFIIVNFWLDIIFCV